MAEPIVSRIEHSVYYEGEKEKRELNWKILYFLVYMGDLRYLAAQILATKAVLNRIMREQACAENEMDAWKMRMESWKPQVGYPDMENWDTHKVTDEIKKWNDKMSGYKNQIQNEKTTLSKHVQSFHSKFVQTVKELTGASTQIRTWVATQTNAVTTHWRPTIQEKEKVLFKGLEITKTWSEVDHLWNQIAISLESTNPLEKQIDNETAKRFDELFKYVSQIRDPIIYHINEFFSLISRLQYTYIKAETVIKEGLLSKQISH
jgi:hypothetical protein